MEVSEDVNLAKEVIQSLLKAKKTLRMYPPNNPIYTKTVEDTYKKACDFLQYRNELCLKIKQNEMLMDGEPVYQGSGKDENLALFFFKDGLREIALKKGLEEEELLDFLKIMAYDFEREDIDEDIVTLLWEKDFQHIRYIVDEEFLTEDQTYEAEAVSQAKENPATEDDLKRAYDDAFDVEEVKEINIMPITEKDLNALVKEMQRDSYDKMERLVVILFDIIYASESAGEFKDLVEILKNALEYSIKNADFKNAIEMLKRAKDLSGSPSISDGYKRLLEALFAYASSRELLRGIGQYLDSGTEVDEDIFMKYIHYLNKDAIQPFMTVLGELKTIEARKSVINALTFLGGKDLNTLAKGLSDSRWYVVRNIIYVLRRIGDRRVVEFLIRAAHHSDIRVRKEVIKALGEMGAQGVIQTLREFLEDPEPSVRIAAVRALGTVGTDAAKKIVLGKISDKMFVDFDFNEKKECFTVLSRWNDGVVFDFLMKTIRKKAFFGRAKNYESRACAAYCFGLLGSRDALSVLHKMRDSKNKLLSEYAYSAIKRIEYGK
jgi:tetratricopeptide (TPR) repeat protein